MNRCTALNRTTCINVLVVTHCHARVCDRKCRLCSGGLSGSAAQSFGSLDILFIELSRRWDGCSANGNFPGT